MSPSSQRVWIEITVPKSTRTDELLSPSSQRVWIEILLKIVAYDCNIVALFTEGVD